MYEGWNHLLSEIKEMPNCSLLMQKVSKEYKKAKVFPSSKNIFNAFKYCPFNNIKVVIVGQDPYPQYKVADGLAFSTQQKETPKSLQIILKEVERTEKNFDFDSNSLKYWTEQGVLLLNTALTVKQNDPGSHSKLWQPFTHRIISYLCTRDEPIVWMLWGKHAKAYSKLINRIKQKHLVLKSDHPAAEIRGTGKFTGNNHFKLCNEFLIKNKIEPIYWATNLPF